VAWLESSNISRVSGSRPPNQVVGRVLPPHRLQHHPFPDRINVFENGHLAKSRGRREVGSGLTELCLEDQTVAADTTERTLSPFCRFTDRGFRPLTIANR
jgi:hypothetical protein